MRWLAQRERKKAQSRPNGRGRRPYVKAKAGTSVYSDCLWRDVRTKQKQITPVIKVCRSGVLLQQNFAGPRVPLIRARPAPPRPVPACAAPVNALRDEAIVKFVKVDTKENLADLNSKFLDVPTFEKLRGRIMTARAIPELSEAAAAA